MMDPWWLLDSGAGEPAWNMALDEALLRWVEAAARPVFRWYGWAQPAASFGYSQRHADVAGWTRLRPLVRRPTGGGLVPHDGDWTYSVAVPPGHAWYALRARESYQRIHQWIAAAFAAMGTEVELAPAARPEALGRCFAGAGAEEGDVLWQGRKIAGAAQRRNRWGLLIQGSIQPPPGMADRAAFQRAFQDAGTGRLQVLWTPLVPPTELLTLATELVATRYARREFTESR